MKKTYSPLFLIPNSLFLWNKGKFWQMVWACTLILFGNASSVSAFDYRQIPVSDFLSQKYTPVRIQWQRPPIKKYPYRAVPYLGDTASETLRQSLLEPQGTFDYRETLPDETYHDWEFCTYENSIIGEYLPPEDVEDRCCACKDGWQCQFESRQADPDAPPRECEIPDLAVTHFTASHTFLNTSSAGVEFDIWIKNEGAAVSQDFRITIADGQDVLAEKSFYGLKALESLKLTNLNFDELTPRYTVVPGDYDFTVQITKIEDESLAEKFLETNTENDQADTSISIKAPDLAVTGAVILPVAGAFQNNNTEQLFTVYAQVANLGREVSQNFDFIIRRQEQNGQWQELLNRNYNRFLNTGNGNTLIFEAIWLDVTDDEETLQIEVVPTGYDADVTNNIFEQVFTIQMLAGNNTGGGNSGGNNGNGGGTGNTGGGNVLTQINTTALTNQGNSLNDPVGNTGLTALGANGNLNLNALLTQRGNTAPAGPTITSFRAFIFTGGTPTTLNPGDKAELHSNARADFTDSIRFYVKSDIGSNARVTWVATHGDGTMVSPYQVRGYSSLGHSASFQLPKVGTYEIMAKIEDTRDPTQKTATDPFIVKVVDER